MGECSSYSSVQADSKFKFAAWHTSWRPSGADRLSLKGRKVNSLTRLRVVDDSTINIALYIIIIIIIIIIHVTLRRLLALMMCRTWLPRPAPSTSSDIVDRLTSLPSRTWRSSAATKPSTGRRGWRSGGWQSA